MGTVSYQCSNIVSENKPIIQYLTLTRHNSDLLAWKGIVSKLKKKIVVGLDKIACDHPMSMAEQKYHFLDCN